MSSTLRWCCSTTRNYARRMPERNEEQAHHDSKSAASISGCFTFGPSQGQQRPDARVTVPPPWLMEPALRVLADLQAPEAIAGLQITATPIDDLNGLTLGLIEPHRVRGEPVELPDDLDPHLPTGPYGGNWVPRSLTGPDLLLLIADLLQVCVLENMLGWGQARPPCPTHPHPACPALHDGEAWWVCPQDQSALYRIGCGEVPRRVRPLS